MVARDRKTTARTEPRRPRWSRGAVRRRRRRLSRGWFYRFQYYHPEEGEILRYDNAHDDDLGWHHRHVSFGEDTEIAFQNVTAHVARFLQEVDRLTDSEDTNDD